LISLLGSTLASCTCAGSGTPNPAGADAGTTASGPAADGGSERVVACPGCPCFPGTVCTATVASGGASDGGAQSGNGSSPPPVCTQPNAAPTLIYPPDQVLFPPNTNVIEVQFRPGAGNTLFEIDFENARTDVRFITRCNPISNTRGIASGGCGFALSADDWHAIADVNRGGDPVQINVRATVGSGCVASSASRAMLFATEDLIGGIYYWQSVKVGGVPGKAGGIYRYDFGRPDLPAEPFLESSPSTNNRCVGCHFLSRDGNRITFGVDDPDSDDEYGDIHSALMDVDNKMLLANDLPPGFRTFSKDHSFMLASDGAADSNSPLFFRFNGNDGTPVDSPPIGDRRGTHPDWAPDDSKVVFAVPEAFLLNRGGMSTDNGDDQHFFGASLFTMSFDGSAFGMPTPLLHSSGENNYYPAYSPDGAFLIFNRVGASGVAGDAFANPAARVMAMPAAGGTPVDLARLNAGDGLSNSWPRWSPYLQQDRGHSILWVTFSSTRDYGLRVQNQEPNGVACYPPESPENSNTGHRCPLVPEQCGCDNTTPCPQFCVQPQLWMAAVEVDSSGGISAGVDTSHPAFWVPAQEISAHNHIAQWVGQVPGHHVMGPDGGFSEEDGGACTDPMGCDGGLEGHVLDSGTGGSCGTSGVACGPGLPGCCTAYICTNGACFRP
jgi:hypothetical protein